MNAQQIKDVTQEEFDDAVQLVISGIKSSDPKLDTRLGTVLRSLLVNPEARLSAAVSKQIDDVRRSTSLKSLRDAEENGGEIDVEDVNAVVSNFNMTSITGRPAEGLVKVVVESGKQSYSISAGAEFSTIDGLVFTATKDITASLPERNTARANTPLYKGVAGYFFLVPVKSEEVGIIYNISKGTSLTPALQIYAFVSAEAYLPFSGGSDAGDIEETIAKITPSLSIRGFVNRNACEGMLRDEFDKGNFPLVACSVAGYRDGVQRRDKHGVFGVGIGGRMDVYVRNFNDIFTKTETVEGVKTEDGSYKLDISPDTFPGSCWVKSVSEITDVNSSLNFRCARKAVGVENTWHDFDISENSSETFNTVWQGLDVVAFEVPSDGIDDTTKEETWSDRRQFQVVVYCLPEARELQSYVDRDDIRSIGTDVVVRCPIICNVSVHATVTYDTDKPIDEEDARYRIRKYINGLGFVGALTRSEIVHILKSCGAVSVSLEKKDMLYGKLHDAYGKEYNLSGDTLNLDGLAPDSAMLSSKTAVFAVEPENIQLTFKPNR